MMFWKEELMQVFPPKNFYLGARWKKTAGKCVCVQYGCRNCIEVCRAIGSDRVENGNS
jgi:hypothetical protein